MSVIYVVRRILVTFLKLIIWIVKSVVIFVYECACEMFVIVGRKVRGVVWFFVAFGVFVTILVAGLNYTPHAITTATQWIGETVNYITNTLLLLMVDKPVSVSQKEKHEAIRFLTTSPSGWMLLGFFAFCAYIVANVSTRSLYSPRKEKPPKKDIGVGFQIIVPASQEKLQGSGAKLVLENPVPQLTLTSE